MEAQRYYDRHLRSLRLSARFEERAKELALSLLVPGPGERILDLGCGPGDLLARIVEATHGGARPLGVDLSPVLLAAASSRAPTARLVRADVARMPLAASSCDACFSSYLLDLLPLEVIPGVLSQAYAVLRPDGRLVLCGLTEGQRLPERLLMALWKGVHRCAPSRVGGCRPLRLRPFVEAAGFAVSEHHHVGQLGVPSEVLLARKPA